MNEPTWRVKRSENVDEQCNQRHSGPNIVWNEKAASSHYQAPGHVGESEKKQVTPTKGIDLILQQFLLVNKM